MNTEQILRYHAAKYPLMRPTDAVKLLYQNEFGSGHLISNAQQSLEKLAKEYNNTIHDTESSLTEPIGNGLVRVNLAALNTERITIFDLNEMFVESAVLIRGSFESFRSKLSLLQRITADESSAHAWPFTYGELKEYLSEYEKSGYPAVSHSYKYRTAYRPAYRIVVGQLLNKYLINSDSKSI